MLGLREESLVLAELVEHQEVCTGLSTLPGSLLLDALQNTPCKTYLWPRAAHRYPWPH